MRKFNSVYFTLVIFCLMIVVSCQKFLDPMPEQRFSEADLATNPAYAEGLLLRAYKLLPTTYNFTLDMASDDAITNKPANSVNEMVLGGWTSSSNPSNQWGRSYEAFLYVNDFLEIAPKVVWDIKSPQKSKSFRDRLIGEAYAMRAIWGFYLLQNHGGMAGGELLGYPILTKELTANDNFELPRNKYAECVKQIVTDLDSAIAKLPLTWADKSGDAVYNATLGVKFINRINGLTAKLFKSRVLLYAASPAFNASAYTWQQAADAAGDVMVDKGGITGLTGAEVEFYKTVNSKEVIWASSREQNRSDLEKNNFLPSLFGGGEANPTQDFVNTFPNLDGTPFNVSAANSVDQYKNRDPRLAKYVVYNGLVFKGATTKLADDPLNIDAPGRNLNATLSGYYLKKFIGEAVSIDPGKPTVGKDIFLTYARYTEALLSFAEAANEAVGPDVAVKGFTARNVINAIRTRAGITSTSYINGLNQDGLRQTIKNERRIELCFEGHRFWDIRRWNDKATMKNSVNGVKFSADNTSATVSQIQVRSYQDYQIYGPIPYSEKLKYDLKQNNGWQ